MEDVADAAVGPNTLAAVGRDGALYLWQDGGPVQVGTGSVRVFFAGGCLFTLQEDGALLRWDGADSRPVPISGPAVEVAGAGGRRADPVGGWDLSGGRGRTGGAPVPRPHHRRSGRLCRDGLWKEDGRLYHARIADGVLTLEPAAEGVAAAVSPRCCLTEDGCSAPPEGRLTSGPPAPSAGPSWFSPPPRGCLWRRAGAPHGPRRVTAACHCRFGFRQLWRNWIK